MNPALDKTVEVECLEPGKLNRVTNTLIDAGGKGINVSKIIKILGGESLATGFICGESGRQLQKIVDNAGIRHDFIEKVGETRTNTKILDEKHGITEINEAGPLLTDEDAENICDKLVGLATKDMIFVLSGKLPEGISLDFYKNLIIILKEKGAKVFLDADGEVLELGMEATPNYIKPNLFELKQYSKVLGGADISLTQIKKVCLELIKEGIELVAVSMGKEGALFVTKSETYFVEGLDVNVASTVGAGDSMVGALAYGIEKKLTLEETICLSMAAAGGAVMTKGTNPPTLELIDKLKKEVKISKE